MHFVLLILLSAALRAEAHAKPDYRNAPHSQANPQSAEVVRQPKPRPIEPSAEERIASYTGWLMIFTAVLALGTLALFGIALYQGRQLRATVLAMERQEKVTVASVEEMRRSADAAWQQTEQSKTAFMALERAYITVMRDSLEWRDVDGFRVLRYSLRNYGRVTGEVVSMTYLLDVNDKGMHTPDHPFNERAVAAPVYPGQDFQMDPVRSDTAQGPLDGYNRHDRALYFLGRIRYCDMHATREAGFTYLWDAPNKTWNAFAGAIGNYDRSVEDANDKQ